MSGVSFSYRDGPPIIEDLRVRWEKGLFHLVIGPSGCGKSTLLHLGAGLLVPQKGDVIVGGQPAAAGRWDTAFAFQDHGLFPWKRVRENLMLPLVVRGATPEFQRERADRMLALLDLRHRARAFPRQLSGGERQRLAIGRALICDPSFLFLDEPLSSLDAMAREELQDRLLTLHRIGRKDLTLVMVTHSIEEAVYLGDRIHIMAAHGRITSVENHPKGRGFRREESYFTACRELRERFEKHTRGER